MEERALDLADDGAQRFPRLITTAQLGKLETIVSPIDDRRAGVRISHAPDLEAWLDGSGLIGIVSDILGSRARVVRAILFDKSTANNWSLGWHQDRTIAVRSREEVAGYGPWTRKAGINHVEPPFDLFESMLTARIHLDPVSVGNAPLLIAPGSHRVGKVTESDLNTVVAQCGTSACLANAGDVWLYRTQILHASAVSQDRRRRRVIQLDFAGCDLPPPLHWQGLQ